MAEAFVGTLRRDCLDGGILDTGESVIRHLRDWIEDYDTVAPHSSPSYRSPVQYRQKVR
jgi:hypothetical protein